jgi:hypothetical protein
LVLRFAVKSLASALGVSLHWYRSCAMTVRRPSKSYQSPGSFSSCVDTKRIILDLALGQEHSSVHGSSLAGADQWR